MSIFDKTFFGRKDYRIDPKGRITLSAEYYSKLNLTENSHVVIVCNPSEDERYLELFSEEEWLKKQKLVDNMEEGVIKDHFLNNYIGAAERIELDGQNRIRLPKYMIEYAGIDKDVVFVGVISNLRIWAKEKLEPKSKIAKQDIYDAINKAKQKIAENGGHE